jgi:hypothetical protein
MDVAKTSGVISIAWPAMLCEAKARKIELLPLPFGPITIPFWDFLAPGSLRSMLEVRDLVLLNLSQS